MRVHNTGIFYNFIRVCFSSVGKYLPGKSRAKNFHNRCNEKLFVGKGLCIHHGQGVLGEGGAADGAPDPGGARV